MKANDPILYISVITLLDMRIKDQFLLYSNVFTSIYASCDVTFEPHPLTGSDMAGSKTKHFESGE